MLKNYIKEIPIEINNQIYLQMVASMFVVRAKLIPEEKEKQKILSKNNYAIN